MKAFFALFLSLSLLLSGCGSPEPQPRLTQTTLAELVDTLAEDYRIPMPVLLDDEMTAGLLDMDTDDMVEYRGYISMSGDAPDQIIGIEAKEGKGETALKKLQARLEFIREDAKSGQTDKQKKAQSGEVFSVGGYSFLVIAGRPDTDPATEAAEIKEKITKSFS